MKSTIAGLILWAGLSIAGAGPASANKEFVVYFEADSSTVPPDGQEVVRAAAEYLGIACPEQKIEVVAHTDSFGPAADNLRRSNAYGQAVAEALIAQGLAAHLISLHAYGEARPSVATADDTREPLNRRVTIWLDDKGDKACFGE